MNARRPAILALDCSAASCSAALWRDGALAAHRFQAMARGQAEALMPIVEATMETAGARYGDLDLVAVTVGPGSFTGVRIGLAAARGIALAAGIPAAGFTSFAVIAAAVPDDLLAGRRLGVAIDDRRGGVYWQELDADRRPATAPRAVSRGALPTLLAGRPAADGLLVVGDGAPLLERIHPRTGPGEQEGLDFGPVQAPPDAAWLARLAADWLASGEAVPAATALPPAPLYLRPAEARLPASASDGRGP